MTCQHAKSPYHPMCAVCSRLRFELEYELHAEQRDPLNVDEMNPTELTECAKHPFVHPEVRGYAAILVHATTKRLEGDIDAAMRAEARAQEVYAKLIPRNLRW